MNGGRAFGLDDADARALGHALRKARYGQGAAALTGADDASVLAHLFALGAGVAREAAQAALDPVGVAALEQAQILEERPGDRVGSRMRVTPHDGLLFLHDRPDRHGPSDQVAAVGPASATLAHLTVRAPVDLALDVGTGCGVQALLMARHARRVIATDVNPRALDAARVNAAINGIENMELRRGDLFEPVGGERFDLIVSNPPFVISPETSHVFRDSELGGDDVSGRVVGAAADHLADGGHATILCEWLSRDGEDWRDVPRRWVAGRGCDALVLLDHSADPEAHGAEWNAGTRAGDPDAYIEAVRRWAAYVRSLGATGVHTGTVVLRGAGERAPWFRAEEASAGPSGGASEHLLHLLAAQDAMPASRAELLGSRLVLALGLELRQLVAYERSGWRTGDAELRGAPGIGVAMSLPAAVVHVLLGIDGERPLTDVLDRAAAELGVDATSLREPALEAARRLLELGFASRLG